MAEATIVCPRCQVPFVRRGVVLQSSRFHVPDPDVCIVCREGLDPAVWLPAEAREKS